MTDDVRNILGIPDGESSAFLNADCMKYLPLFPDNCFDLAIVDPPYGINANSFGMGDHLRGRGDSTARKVERKRRLNQGAGKLKDRALQNMNCDWDFKIPPPRILFRVAKGIKESNHMGRKLFRPSADARSHLLGQRTTVGKLLTVGNGVDVV